MCNSVLWSQRHFRQQQVEQAQARRQAEQGDQVGGIGLNPIAPALEEPYVRA